MPCTWRNIRRSRCGRIFGPGDAPVAHLFDIGKAHVGDGGAAVQSALLLHLQHDMLQHLLLVVNEAVQGLIVNGIFEGVGSVLSFLPVIVTMFFFLSLLLRRLGMR